VIATRIWYDRRVPTRYPANVLSGFEPAAGATFFNLTDLHVSGVRVGRMSGLQPGVTMPVVVVVVMGGDGGGSHCRHN
jgi:hypothetical protein